METKIGEPEEELGDQVTCYSKVSALSISWCTVVSGAAHKFKTVFRSCSRKRIKTEDKICDAGHVPAGGGVGENGKLCRCVITYPGAKVCV